MLKAPLTVPESIGDIQSILNFFPQPCTIDPHTFMSEFSNFVVHTQMNNKSFENMKEIASFAHQMRNVFPLTRRCYQLLLTIPVTVAKDERTFSRLKIVKTPLRTTMSDQRLESLLLGEPRQGAKTFCNWLGGKERSLRWLNLQSCEVLDRFKTKSSSYPTSI